LKLRPNAVADVSSTIRLADKFFVMGPISSCGAMALVDNVIVHIFVEELDDGTFEVVTHKDGKPWMRYGPFADLNYANMTCREMRRRAEALRDRLVKSW
jgi:hypothetical protein